MVPAKYSTFPSISKRFPTVFAKFPCVPIGYTQAGCCAEVAAWIVGAAMLEPAITRLKIARIVIFILIHRLKDIQWIVALQWHCEDFIAII